MDSGADGRREDCGLRPAVVSWKYSSHINLAIESVEKLNAALIENRSVLVPLDENLVDTVWRAEGAKAGQSKAPVFIHDIKYSGESAELRIERVKTLLLEKKCDATVISSLDQIAWILNLRGSDIPFNPLFKAYLTMEFVKNTTNVVLYADPDKFADSTVQNHLRRLKISLLPYSAVASELKKWTNKHVGVELESVNAKILQSIKTNSVADLQDSLPRLKSVKNTVELNGYRKCHIRDGAGLVGYLSWLDYQLNVEHRTDITEYMGAEKAREFRSRQPLFMGLSFDSISSIGKNGSVIHYSPEKEGSLPINNREVYLLDSGCQYLYPQVELSIGMELRM